MSEIEERLKAVMENPAELERIAAMAQSLMGNIAPPQGADNQSGGDMAAMAAKVAGLLRSGDGNGLVNGLSPYLSEKRRKRLARALRLASAAGAAGTILNEMDLNS